MRLTQQPWVCPPYICAFRTPPARAEPAVSACVLEKSLELRRYMTYRPMAAAVFGVEIYAEEVVVRWRNAGSAVWRRENVIQVFAVSFAKQHFK